MTCIYVRTMKSVQFLELNLMVMKIKIESGARFNLCVKHEFYAEIAPKIILNSEYRQI